MKTITCSKKIVLILAWYGIIVLNGTTCFKSAEKKYWSVDSKAEPITKETNSISEKEDHNCLADPIARDNGIDVYYWGHKMVDKSSKKEHHIDQLENSTCHTFHSVIANKQAVLDDSNLNSREINGSSEKEGQNFQADPIEEDNSIYLCSDHKRVDENSEEENVIYQRENSTCHTSHSVVTNDQVVLNDLIKTAPTDKEAQSKQVEDSINYAVSSDENLESTLVCSGTTTIRDDYD
ncbi:hypothetical protein ACRRVB_00285 [Candidatus Cardinium hertigii]|uniref:hypothetical protein n=1 Tax=Candidatus Cardinium hertigii TaxID=247481 RepID=UPI003D7D0B3C